MFALRWNVDCSLAVANRLASLVLRLNAVNIHILPQQIDFCWKLALPFIAWGLFRWGRSHQTRAIDFVQFVWEHSGINFVFFVLQKLVAAAEDGQKIDLSFEPDSLPAPVDVAVLSGGIHSSFEHLNIVTHQWNKIMNGIILSWIKRGSTLPRRSPYSGPSSSPAPHWQPRSESYSKSICSLIRICRPCCQLKFLLFDWAYSKVGFKFSSCSWNWSSCRLRWFCFWSSFRCRLSVPSFEGI